MKIFFIFSVLIFLKIEGLITHAMEEKQNREKNEDPSKLILPFSVPLFLNNSLAPKERALSFLIQEKYLSRNCLTNDGVCNENIVTVRHEKISDSPHGIYFFQEKEKEKEYCVKFMNKKFAKSSIRGKKNLEKLFKNIPERKKKLIPKVNIPLKNLGFLNHKGKWVGAQIQRTIKGDTLYQMICVDKKMPPWGEIGRSFARMHALSLWTMSKYKNTKNMKINITTSNYCHMDAHPGNLILNEEGIHLIDNETFGENKPEKDFKSLFFTPLFYWTQILSSSTSRIFLLGGKEFLHGYFNEIPQGQKKYLAIQYSNYIAKWLSRFDLYLSCIWSAYEEEKIENNPFKNGDTHLLFSQLLYLKGNEKLQYFSKIREKMLGNERKKGTFDQLKNPEAFYKRIQQTIFQMQKEWLSVLDLIINPSVINLMDAPVVSLVHKPPIIQKYPVEDIKKQMKKFSERWKKNLENKTNASQISLDLDVENSPK